MVKELVWGPSVCTVYGSLEELVETDLCNLVITGVSQIKEEIEEYHESRKYYNAQSNQRNTI